MGGEVCNLVVDWSIALASILYCHGVGMFIAQGTTRFLLIFPVICLFLYLPLNLNTVFFAGPTSFFLSWLGSFKLILYAFGQPPFLSSNPPSICTETGSDTHSYQKYEEKDPRSSLPLSHFVATICLPIKIIRNQDQNMTKKSNYIDHVPEVLLFIIVIKLYGYKDDLHPLLIMCLIAYYFLFMLVLLLAMVAILVRTLIRVQLEPQFNKPQYATSVQNFWGKRWNLMVSDTLRHSIYYPARAIFSHLVPERWVSVPATFVTFLVSGIMHEIVLYHLGQFTPTWEVTWFFIINGVWVGAEIAIKKTMDHQKFEHPVVGWILTSIFLIITSFWLFFPPFLRLEPCARICKEVMGFVSFFKNGHLIKDVF